MQILLSLRYHIYKVYKPCTNYNNCNIYISYNFYKFYIICKLKLTVMEEDKIPLWKKLAMEKGLITEEAVSSSATGNENARSYAEILDALLGDLEKTYQVINEMLAQKRRTI